MLRFQAGTLIFVAPGCAGPACRGAFPRWLRPARPLW